MQSFAVNLLGWVLAAAAVVIVVPQLRRLLTTDVHEGFSLRGSSLAIASCLAWVSYTISEGDVPALASSLVPMFIWIACGAIVSSRRGVLARFLAGTGLLGGCVLLGGVLTGLFHVFAVAGSLVWLLPQARTALAGDRLDAVSTPTYVLLFVENLGWIAYALGTGRLAYMIAPIFQAPLAALVAVKAARHHAAPDGLVAH